MGSDPRFIKYNLKAEDYQPLIPGDAKELLECMGAHDTCFPKSVKVFGSILQAHIQRHPFLEDWLIIPHYQFFWDSNLKALRWFEGLYSEAITLGGANAWQSWLEETIKQTDCSTTHALCGRLYDFHLQLYGGMYLAREGWEVHFILPRDDEKKPDVKGVRNGQECVLECKFVHTSEKYESFWHRFNIAGFKYFQPRPRPLFCEQFRFPSSLKIKSLSSIGCSLVKAFTRRVYENPDLPQIGIFANGSFVYTCSLPPALVPIDAQYEFAQSQGKGFASNYLRRLLGEAALQLGKSEYSGHRKILFIGLQPDALYFAPWNEVVISEVKSILSSIAKLQQIEAIFSEDIGFSVRGYV